MNDTATRYTDDGLAQAGKVMRTNAIAVLALVGFLNAGQAKADNLSCDFFQNAVIGTRCATTISLTAGLDYSALKSTYASVGPNQSLWSSENSDLTVGSFAVGWTPTNWFTLQYSSGYNAAKDSFSYQNSFYGIYFSMTFSGSGSANYGYVGSQTVVVNVYDSGAGLQRIVLNLFAGGSYQPSFTTYLPIGSPIANPSDSVVYGGFSAYDSFRINQDFSITPSVSAQFDHSSNAGNDIFYSSARVLFSNDRIGSEWQLARRSRRGTG